MSWAGAALLHAYPGRFEPATAEAWVAARRALLLERGGTGSDPSGVASSGCAAAGAAQHARRRVEEARHALRRLDDGFATQCEVCTATLDWERLDIPAAVTCPGCARREA